MYVKIPYLILSLLLLSGVVFAAERSLYDFSLVSGDGRELPLSTFKGKVVLIVNLASASMFKDQIPALSKLQDQYKDKGLVVIGVPSNDFGEGEPGTDAEVQKFYKDEQKVTFAVMAKSPVHGKDELPVYSFLTGAKKDGKPGEEVHWSYTKFIVDREGQVVARFEPDMSPSDPDFEIAIDRALSGKLKPAPEKKPAAASAAADRDRDRRD